MFTRRQFVWTSLAVAAAPMVLPRRAMAKPRQFPDVPLATTKLRDNIYAIIERGGNSTLILTADGPILIDTKLTSSGGMLAEEAAKIAGGAAPKLVINTHHHFDHTGGNHVFNDGSEIIAHKNLNPRMQAMLNNEFKPGIATQVNALRNAGKDDEARAMAAWAESLTARDFQCDKDYDQTLTIERGDAKLVLQHLGNGHTDNDTLIFMPEANVLVMGDLLFYRVHPFVDRAAGATTVGWCANVAKAIEMCDDQTIVVPGHGTMTNKAGLATQITYFETMRELVNAAIRQGKSKESIALIEPEQFKEYAFPELRKIALAAMYDEATEGMN